LRVDPTFSAVPLLRFNDTRIVSLISNLVASNCVLFSHTLVVLLFCDLQALKTFFLAFKFKVTDKSLFPEKQGPSNQPFFVFSQDRRFTITGLVVSCVYTEHSNNCNVLHIF